MSSDPSNVPILDDHLLEALESSKDRISVLRLEQDIVAFLEDTTRDVLELPAVNSYQKRLAHKTGDYYQLTHVSDASRQLILFHKHPWTKMPAVKLSDISVSNAHDAAKHSAMHNQPRLVKIMKRTPNVPSPSEVKKSTVMQESDLAVKEKEKVEKEERYKAARARIFQGVDESAKPGTSDKASKPASKNNSRSNSRDARHKALLNGDAAVFSRRVSDPYIYEAGPTIETDLIQKRHQQYFQSSSSFSAAHSFSRPPVDTGKNFPGIWNPSSSAPLSAANLAALEAQTSKTQSIVAPVVRAQSPHIGSGRLLTPHSNQKSLAPPLNASANLWGPPQVPSTQATRSASAMGLNLGASPWMPKQQSTVRALSSPPPQTLDNAESGEEDPANVLRGLALDDK